MVSVTVVVVAESALREVDAGFDVVVPAPFLELFFFVVLGQGG